MVDIRLISIIPPAQVSSVQQPQVTTGGAATPTIATFPPGTLLSGFIINRDAGGNPILRTESGDIAFQSNFFLKIGSEVEIRVQQNAGQTIARILTVNGQAPELAQTQSAFADDPQVILPPSLGGQRAVATASTNTPATVQTPARAPELTLNATLLTAAPADAPDAPSPAPAGTQVTLKVLALQVATDAPETATAATQTTPQQPAQTASTTQQPSPLYSAYAKWSTNSATPEQPATQPQTSAAPTTQTTSPTTPQAAAPAPTNAAPAAPQTPAGQPAAPTQTAIPPTTSQQNVQTLLADISPEVAAANPAPANSPAAQAPLVPTHVAPRINQRIDAVVVGHETSGEALLETEIGLLRLPASTPLTTGSKLSVEITQLLTPSLMPPVTVNTAPATIPQLAQSWPSLSNVFMLLSGDSDLTNFDFSRFLMPSLGTTPDAQAHLRQPLPLASGLMNFIAALRTGDFRSWLGKGNAEALEEKGHGALLAKASAEFLLMANQFNNPAPGQWQMLLFPIAVDGVLQQVRMFTKRDRKKDSEGNPKQEDDTRFVIEMDLSQLGEMQMDGFVRRKPENMQFDLIIRSLSPLGKDIQRDIQDIFLTSSELTGFKGSVAFQLVKNFPVLPLEELAGGSLSNVIA